MVNEAEYLRKSSKPFGKRSVSCDDGGDATCCWLGVAMCWVDIELLAGGRPLPSVDGL